MKLLFSAVTLVLVLFWACHFLTLHEIQDLDARVKVLESKQCAPQVKTYSM